jgi:hypothetical protein
MPTPSTGTGDGKDRGTGGREYPEIHAVDVKAVIARQGGVRAPVIVSALGPGTTAQRWQTDRGQQRRPAADDDRKLSMPRAAYSPSPNREPT